MIYFVISLCGLALACVTFRRWVGRTARANPYSAPPLDWPDIPVTSLALFQPIGHINTPPSGGAPPMRVASFEAAQDIVLGLVTGPTPVQPDIALRLSPHGRDWTDVLLNGAVVVQVPTGRLLEQVARPTAPV